MRLLEDKVVFITGGARGQGRAHAVVSARQGADVVLFDVAARLTTVPYSSATPEDLDETVALVKATGRRALAVQGDVRSQSDLDSAVSRALDEFGRIDCLIANAGIWTRAPFWELDENTWNEMIDINLTGVWKSAKAVAPHMIERQSGSIVVISSVNGLEPGLLHAHYVSAKHGVLGLMKNIALELAPHGIRCNAVCPGAIETPMTNHQGTWDMMAGGPGGTEQAFFEGGRHYGALKGTSFLPPEDVANAVLMLNSPLAAALTGVVFPVDAGHMLLSGFNHTPTPG